MLKPQAQTKTILIFTLGILLMGALVLTTTACKPKAEPTAESLAAKAEEDPIVEEPEVTELLIDDTLIGEGDRTAQVGDTVVISWGAHFMDDIMFNSSTMMGGPTEFTIGDGAVIAGWDEGVRGMKVGGIRYVTVPANMGFTEETGFHGEMPINTPLKFEIELLEIK